MATTLWMSRLVSVVVSMTVPSRNHRKRKLPIDALPLRSPALASSSIVAIVSCRWIMATESANHTRDGFTLILEKVSVNSSPTPGAVAIRTTSKPRPNASSLVVVSKTFATYRRREETAEERKGGKNAGSTIVVPNAVLRSTTAAVEAMATISMARTSVNGSVVAPHKWIYGDHQNLSRCKMLAVVNRFQSLAMARTI
uniref:Putative secreted protein n=1 Tax=Anopheles darlingi TaxID=43151 RepID=A0A2M4D0Q3_ANODA